MNFSPKLDRWRVRNGPYGSNLGEPFGAFFVPGPCGRDLKIIASSGDPTLDIYWEHVSVSLTNRPPNWEEMCFVKDLFWDAEEAAMQLHPPKSRWINNHNYCLHLWRPTNQEIPLPPDETVGRKELGELTDTVPQRNLR
jgi:hypothetical protein